MGRTEGVNVEIRRRKWSWTGSEGSSPAGFGGSAVQTGLGMPERRRASRVRGWRAYEVYSQLATLVEVAFRGRRGASGRLSRRLGDKLLEARVAINVTKQA
ncbi:hypothetical protein MAPG_08610 [Magnaporthiopsis poae ATCC 64411]|uniref:Uncharacterized protein n=1 Tax=Magnaporthiopsis poae (strain ATCC 64411 / 73-15) TaxID=644358 RepID=A0A0C4E7T8_MAGP6|nr:hypothetical protein MAPG_08610 [Magnaporthiopsis poae ATCC 64411]